jgi:hypothetical protein
VEALRAGVPNRDVVRQLPPMQPAIEQRFETLLGATEEGGADGKQAPGLLVEGDFGTGKSHWMEYFRHLALENNFVCSSIVLNKETPLYDLVKVYRACVESAAAPGKVGPALAEITHTYDADRAPRYRELFEWVHQNKELDPRFAATLFLFERNPDENLREKIVAEWTGYPMYVGELKTALRQTGELTPYQITRPQKGQPLQRFAFLARFFRSAGYNGWVVLLDETEMISKYSLRQRGRAYAHLAQLMGPAPGITGLASVFTITKDYAGQVLFGRKNDIVTVPARMEGTRDEEYVAPAKAGMRVIESKALDLRPPTPDQVQAIYQKVRALYAGAYGWDAPEIADKREYSSSTGWRQYVRSWINTWDLRRLYDYQAETVVEEVPISYEEDKDLQTENADNDEPMITI